MSTPLPYNVSPEYASSPSPKIDPCVFRSVTLRRPSAIKRTVAPVSSVRCANAHPISGKSTMWQLADNAVKVVPTHYPLERTRRTIRGVKASEIAARVSHVARLMNIAATYDSENAIARLSTHDHVELYINLYEHPECARSTIIEAQRWRGCGILYHRYAHRLLDAAEGLPIDVNGINVKGITTRRRTTESLGRGDDIIRDALVLADKLLQDGRVDAQQLGLEMLLRMTQPEAVSSRTALLTSRTIVFGTSFRKDNTYQSDSILALTGKDRQMLSLNIREKVLSFIGPGKPRDKVGAHVSHQFAEEQWNVFSAIALHVFANALDIIAMKASGIRSVERTVVKDLVQFLNTAKERPHHAFLSAKCLGILLVSSQEVRQITSELALDSAMRGAREIGRCSHAGLEMEMEKVVAALAVTGEA